MNERMTSSVSPASDNRTTSSVSGGSTASNRARLACPSAAFVPGASPGGAAITLGEFVSAATELAGSCADTFNAADTISPPTIPLLQNQLFMLKTSLL